MSLAGHFYRVYYFGKEEVKDVYLGVGVDTHATGKTLEKTYIFRAQEEHYKELKKNQIKRKKKRERTKN